VLKLTYSNPDFLIFFWGGPEPPLIIEEVREEGKKWGGLGKGKGKGLEEKKREEAGREGKERDWERGAAPPPSKNCHYTAGIVTSVCSRHIHCGLCLSCYKLTNFCIIFL